MPNANERSWFGSVAAPEYVSATELVLQHEFSRHTRFTGSWYRYLRTNQMVYSDAIGDYAATGASRSHGLEIELESMWDNGIRTRGSMAWQHAIDVDGAGLVNSPNFLVKFNLTFPMLANTLRTGLEGQYIGSRLTLVNTKWCPPLTGALIAALPRTRCAWMAELIGFSSITIFEVPGSASGIRTITSRVRLRPVVRPESAHLERRCVRADGYGRYGVALRWPDNHLARQHRSSCFRCAGQDRRPA